VGVAGEIGEDLLGPGEGRLGVDKPFLLPQRREVRDEGPGDAEWRLRADRLSE
jgi:hypothetical protein